MITFDSIMNEKIDLLDSILSAVSLAELREFAEKENIVAKIKGTQPQFILRTVLSEHNAMLTSIPAMANDLSSLKLDFVKLTKILNQVVFGNPYNQDFNDLKQKYGIY